MRNNLEIPLTSWQAAESSEHLRVPRIPTLTDFEMATPHRRITEHQQAESQTTTLAGI